MDQSSLALKNFYDEATYTHTYVVYDTKTQDAVIIDPVLDYDPAGSLINYSSANEIIAFIEKHNLKVTAILETHAHADHLSSAQWLKKKLGNPPIGIGKNITVVQSVFKKIYNVTDLETDGRQFDLLIEEGKLYNFGSIEMKAIFTPGHTPACSSYIIGNYLFTGDTLFMPDYGTGRCDFPGGSSDDLYTSVHDKLYQLDENLITCTGHDYCPRGRKVKFCATLKEQMEENIQLNINTTRPQFVNFRNERDSNLSAPRLLLQSIQYNIRGGNFGAKESNGEYYLKIPVRGIIEE